MAKRASPNEEPFRPLLDVSLVSAAVSAAATPATQAPSDKPQQLRAVELSKRDDREPPGRGDPQGRPSSQAAGSAAAPDVRPHLQPLVDKFDQEKRILFTRRECQALDRVISSLAMRLNSPVKASHVVRASVALLLNAQAEIDRRAGECMSLVRPPNGDAVALQRFEREIANIILSGIRDAGPLR